MKILFAAKNASYFTCVVLVKIKIFPVNQHVFAMTNVETKSLIIILQEDIEFRLRFQEVIAFPTQITIVK